MNKNLVFVLGFLVIAVSAHAKDAGPAKGVRKTASNETKCVVVAKDNIPFESANEKVDEYLAVEKKEYGGVIFKYMEGHGQSRLAAYRGGKLIAATFSSRSIELNLDVGKLEAGCFGLNGQTE